MNDERIPSAKWLVTVVDRGEGQKVADILEENGVRIRFAALGHGTAKSEVLDYWGLDGPEKDVVISLVNAERSGAVIGQLKERMQYARPGTGITFTVRISGFNSSVLRYLPENGAEERRESMLEGTEHELVVSVVDHGQADRLMEAAKGAGARGGTVIKARGLVSDEVAQFFKIKIQPEKDLVLIVVEKGVKHAVMQAICDQFSGKDGSRSFTFSMPIDEVAGIVSAGQ